MKKKFFVLFLSLVMSCMMIFGLTACNSNNKSLKLDKDGEFKILQLTDTQFSQSGKMTGESKLLLDNLIDEADADLIVITGDIISAEHWLGFYPSYKEDSEKLVQFCGEIRDYFDSKKTPWTLTFGNHDGLTVTDKVEKYKDIRKKMLDAYSAGEYFIGGTDAESKDYNCFNDPNEMSYTNFSFPIKDRNGKTAYNIYTLDCYPVGGGYPPLLDTQVDFYKKESARLKEANGGNIVPSLIFYHESLPSFVSMKRDYDVNNGSGKTKVMKGAFGDKMFGGPQENAKIEEAMIANKDIIGVFVGHDHLNTLAGYYEMVDGYKVLLGYGRMSAIADYMYAGLSRTNFIRGGRVIELNNGNIKTYEILCTPDDINANPFTSYTLSTANEINTANY